MVRFAGRQRMRRPSPTLCRDCSAPVLEGLDGDVAAVMARVDPAPVHALGEYLGLQQGRRSYRLGLDGLDARDKWQIAGNPAGPDVAVVLDHLCGSPVHFSWWATAKVIREDGSVAPDSCPF